MRELIPTPRFERALRKFTKRDDQLRERVQKTLEQMQEEVFATNLGTHKLSGSLDGIYACTCGYDCRVLFLIQKDLTTESESIVLLDVGNHNDVY